jgi:hypothetical protein
MGSGKETARGCRAVSFLAGNKTQGAAFSYQSVARDATSPDYPPSRPRDLLMEVRSRPVAMPAPRFFNNQFGPCEISLNIPKSTQRAASDCRPRAHCRQYRHDLHFYAFRALKPRASQRAVPNAVPPIIHISAMGANNAAQAIKP